jgi:ubiquinone/menaquinone biosynthesis C-methylase UbiE
MNTSYSISPRQLVQRRGDYGFDAPYVPIILLCAGLAAIILGLLVSLLWQIPIWGSICLLWGMYLLLSGASYIYTTRRGKFQVWAELLVGLNLRGDEQVLDMGCGRGAILLMAANLLDEGKATGVDIWSTRDQSGNAREVTLKNAELEGVAGKIELHTADMRELPFANGTFDLVLSSLAIHNISQREGQDKALEEAVRVLKPNGRLIIADIRATKRHAEHLHQLGMIDISHQLLDWHFWYSPWIMTHLVKAHKPS